MTDFTFLTYIPDPFGVRPPAMWLRAPSGTGRIDPAALSLTTSSVVTYDVSALVDELRRYGLSPPTSLINITDALRLIVGKPRDEGGERQWNVWGKLRQYFSEPREAREFELLTQSRVSRPEEPELTSRLEAASGALARLWSAILSELDAAGEASRFFKVEVPIQSLFAKRQSAGVGVSHTAAAALLAQLLTEKYTALVEVADALGQNPTGLNFWNIAPLIAGTDAADLVSGGSGAQLRESFKMARQRSTFADSFLRYTEASSDEVILRRAAGNEQRLFPTMSCVGTVSGRIIVSDPNLQQLRRKYRGIISADEGRQLCYLDYAQFEPGILAFVSGDERLASEYCQGDIYTSLAVSLFSDASARPLAKRVFLAFSYGMSADAISRLVTRSSEDSRRAEIKSGVENFFSAYPRVADFNARMIGELERTGLASSLHGNARHRVATGPLTPKERRWAVNQPVQATAALIFKEALLELESQMGWERILLPVHDAVLMQFDGHSYEDELLLAREIMEGVFARRCPGVTARVTAGPFNDYELPRPTAALRASASGEDVSLTPPH